MAENPSQKLTDAHAQRISGAYEDAAVLYRQLLDDDGQVAEAWWGLGLVLMNIGEFDEALEALDKALTIDPNQLKFLLDLGKLQTMLGMFEEAKPVFERIVELDGSSREADEARNQLRYY